MVTKIYCSFRSQAVVCSLLPKEPKCKYKLINRSYIININQLNNKIKRIETEFNINKLLSKQKSVIDMFIYNLEMNDYEKE